MAAKKMNAEELLRNLMQFTGTTQWYRNPLFPSFTYTDGVQFLAENAGCYWLIDFIFSHQLDVKIKNAPFQVWTRGTSNVRTESAVKESVISSFYPIYLRL